jgi:hypothetical protein
MKGSKLGLLAASAVANLIGTAAFADDVDAGKMGGGIKRDEKACYHPYCGDSVKGHESKCAGSRVDELKDQAACENAGGAWTTPAAAKKFKM